MRRSLNAPVDPSRIILDSRPAGCSRPQAHALKAAQDVVKRCRLELSIQNRQKAKPAKSQCTFSHARTIPTASIGACRRSGPGAAAILSHVSTAPAETHREFRDVEPTPLRTAVDTAPSARDRGTFHPRLTCDRGHTDISLIIVFTDTLHNSYHQVWLKAMRPGPIDPKADRPSGPENPHHSKRPPA